MISNILFLLINMLDKKIYSYEDLDNFYEECVKLIGRKFDELNCDKIIFHPTDQDYKNISREAIEKVTEIPRCLGIYVSGKNKGQRCQAPPYLDTNYCAKHKSQDPEKKQLK